MTYRASGKVRRKPKAIAGRDGSGKSEKSVARLTDSSAHTSAHATYALAQRWSVARTAGHGTRRPII